MKNERYSGLLGKDIAAQNISDKLNTGSVVSGTYIRYQVLSILIQRGKLLSTGYLKWHFIYFFEVSGSLKSIYAVYTHC